MRFSSSLSKDMHFSLILPAFIAGILTFLAPCTLPLVPGYLGFISGASLKDLENPEKAQKLRRKIFLNGLFFVLGFSAIFIAQGTFIGFLGGRLFASSRLWLEKISGFFVILFGLFMLHFIRVPFFDRAIKFHVPTIFERGKPINSFILGSAFAFGWTPCVGPILGAILTLAAVSETAAQGAFFLSVFSLGLAIPFLLIAISISSVSRYFARITKYLRVFELITGFFLIFLGVLLVTNMLGIWVSFFYRIFDFIHYDRLLDYL